MSVWTSAPLNVPPRAARHVGGRLRRAGRATAVGGALAAALTAATLVVPAVSADAATPVTSPFRAGAWATTVSVAGVYTADKTAPVGTGCSPNVGVSRANSLVSTSVAGLFTTGTLRNTATVTAGAAGTVVTTAKSQIQGVGLLGGIVSIGTLTSQSSVTWRPNGTSTATDAGTSLASVSIFGVPLLSINPNLRIELPGIGSLVLDEQIPAPGGGLIVNLVHLTVDATATEVIIGHSAVLPGTDGPLQGVAYTAKSDIAGIASIGALSAASVGCNGTGGRTRSNSISAVSLPGLGTAGVGTNSAYGVVDFSALTAVGRTQSTLTGVSLFNILGASTITADIEVDYAGGAATYVDRSSFVSLNVFGQSLPIDVVPNTTITLVPGVTLYLHRVVTAASVREVRMIELVVSAPNSLGLPNLLDLRVGVAKVGVDADLIAI